jgi:hypothetical protein
LSALDHVHTKRAIYMKHEFCVARHRTTMIGLFLIVLRDVARRRGTGFSMFLQTPLKAVFTRTMKLCRATTIAFFIIGVARRRATTSDTISTMLHLGARVPRSRRRSRSEP